MSLDGTCSCTACQPTEVPLLIFMFHSVALELLCPLDEGSILDTEVFLGLF